MEPSNNRSVPSLSSQSLNNGLNTFAEVSIFIDIILSLIIFLYQLLYVDLRLVIELIFLLYRLSCLLRTLFWLPLGPFFTFLVNSRLWNGNFLFNFIFDPLANQVEDSLIFYRYPQKSLFKFSITETNKILFCDNFILGQAFKDKNSVFCMDYKRAKLKSC